MANPVDVAIKKEALDSVRELNALIKQSQAEVLKLGSDFLNASKNISGINTPSALSANSKNNANYSANAQAQAQQITQAQSKIQASVDRLRLAEIRLEQQREKAFDKYESNLKKEEQAIRRAETAYQRIQNSVNILTKTYQDLAIRRELGGNLTVKEEAQLASLTKRLNLYQTALKKVDSDMQKNGRNVGNYASGFNGLNNSINQLTRELPAFTFSAQTGFLALSNNIPILTDEIGRLIDKNKELTKQGQPIKSVFSQIIGAVFSLQTAMGIGILLTTLYGKEISAFVGNLFSFEKSLSSSAKAQKIMNEASKEGVKNAQEELVSLKVNLEIAQDVTKSYDQRKLAVNQLKETYPDYLKNISDEAILSGEAEVAVKALTIAIINNAKAQAAKTRILENETKRLDLLDEEVRLNNEIAKQDKENIKLEARVLNEVKTTSDRNIALDRYNNGTARSLSLKRDLIQNTKELNSLDEVNASLTDYVVKNTTLFNEKQTKAAKEKQREKIEDIKIESEGYSSAIKNLEEQIALIKEMQQANSGNKAMWDFYQTSIDQLSKMIVNIKEGYKEIQDSAKEAGKSLELQNQIIEDGEARMKRLREATDSFLSSFSDSFLSDAGLGSFQKFFDGTFNQLMAGAETMEDKFKVAFLAISEAAQEAFNFINESSQANFDAEYARLEKQKEIAIMFAGESTTAQEEIQRQYEERKKAIQRREAEAQKRLAVFNILIDTAQAVVSALPNIPLSIAVGVIGALQAGFVASQPIPQFFEGGTHKGGLMLVNDAKGNNYRETIVTPDGKIIQPTQRNVLMNAPSGTEIYTPEQWHEKQLNDMLMANGIGYKPTINSTFAASNQSNGLTKDQFDAGINKLSKSIKNAPSSQVMFDELGYRKFQTVNGQRKQRLNNRFNINGK